MEKVDSWCIFSTHSTYVLLRILIPALIVLFEMFWLQLSLSQSNGMILLRSIRTLVMFVYIFH